jgi:hypothetical protein
MACNYGTNDSCGDNSDPTSCLASWGGLMNGDGNAVTIGPYNSAIVYLGAYYATFTSNPCTGPYVLSARTESIQ